VLGGKIDFSNIEFAFDANGAMAEKAIVLRTFVY